MWPEVALTGMVAIWLISKVDTPKSLRRSSPAYVWAGPSPHYFAARGSGRCNGELCPDELRGALAQAIASIRADHLAGIGSSVRRLVLAELCEEVIASRLGPGKSVFFSMAALN
jgi:hypothetical protein